MPQELFGAPRRRVDHRDYLPSFNFLFVLAIFSGSGAILWHDYLSGRYIVFVFILAGWVVSLCLHEFGHALTAYLCGDTSVVETGYLTLDPVRYSDPLLSLVLPVLFIVFGGIGLPGGAVYIQNGRLRRRWYAALVAAAGPLGNLVCLVALAMLYQYLVGTDGPADLAAGIGALAFFQATAIVLNLLPVPGLDGFAILRPFLPANIAALGTQMAAGAMILLFLALWWTQLGASLFRVGMDIVGGCGIDIASAYQGLAIVRLR